MTKIIWTKQWIVGFNIKNIEYHMIFSGQSTNEMYVFKHRNVFFFCQWAWPWSYDSWIYNYLCNQCLSPLKLWVRTQLRRGVFDTTLCDKVCQWLATGRWFSLGTPVSSTNKTDRHDITEMLLKVALIIIKPTKPMSAFKVVPNFLYLFLICLSNMY